MVKFGLKIAAFFGRKSSSVVAPKVMQEAFSSGLVKSRNCGLFAKEKQKAVKSDNVGKIVDTLS